MTGSDMEIDSDEDVIVISSNSSPTHGSRSSSPTIRRPIERDIEYNELVKQRFKHCYVSVNNARNTVIEERYGPFTPLHQTANAIRTETIMQNRDWLNAHRRSSTPIMNTVDKASSVDRVEPDMGVHKDTIDHLEVSSSELTRPHSESSLSATIPTSESMKEQEIYESDNMSISSISSEEPLVVFVKDEDEMSESSYHSALDYFDNDDGDYTTEITEVEQEIKRTQEEVDRIASEKKEIQVKLLEMRVRMSIEQNRKASVKSTPYRLGSKRSKENEEENIQKRRITSNTDYSPRYYPPYPTQYIPPNYMLPPPPSLPPPPTSPPPPPPPPPPPSPPITSPVLNTPLPVSVKKPPVWINDTSNRKYKHKHKHTHRPSDSIQPLRDAGQLSQYITETEQLIKFRVSSNSDKVYPHIQNRQLPRPSRLVTIDGYTMSMDMIFLDQKNTPTTPIQDTFRPTPTHEIKMTDDMHHSPFFIMLRRKATQQVFTPTMESIVEGVVATIPNDIDYSLLEVKEYYGLLTQNLLNTLNYVRKMEYEYPQNEFLKALKLELSLYVNGSSPTFTMDFNDSCIESPLSVDIYWQRIRAENTLPHQITLILDLLRSISETHTSFESEESTHVSSKTTEVLIRTLRLCGLNQVLEILTGKSVCISDTELEIFSMDDAPGLYLTEQDKYLVWMLILHYYVTKTLPDSVCDTWMNSLVKDGVPSMKKPLFMIDWTNALSNAPLDTHTHTGAINILLSLLRHFGNKTCNDARRRPLLIGVLRTLFNFLSFTPYYKMAGTLMLAKIGLPVSSLKPEIQEMVADLEIRTSGSEQSAFDCIMAAKQTMSVTKVLSLSYRLAKSLYDTNYNLLTISKAVSLPVNTSPPVIDGSEDIVLVDMMRQKYLSILQMDSLIYYANEAEPEYRGATFAWMNLLLLTQISKCLYGESSPVLENLKNHMELALNEGMRNVKIEDGKLLIFKYSKQLLGYEYK